MNPAGSLLVAAAVLALVGASLGFGGGIVVGFALIPLALILLAAGIVGSVIVTPDLDRVFVLLATGAASCAVLMALLGMLMAVDYEGIRRTVEGLLRPGFAILVLAIVVFAITGMATRQLPVFPAGAVAVGTLLLGAGLVEQERVADLGFWTSLAGWTGLGLMPWGRD